MKQFTGYLKRKLGDSYALLAGGGTKSLSDFLGSILYDSENKKILYKASNASNWSDLVSFGDRAFDSTTYSTTDENVKLTSKTDNANRPLMMINGSTSAGDLTSTSMFSTGIYANASTKMITANGFVKADSNSSYVLLGDGGLLHVDTIMSRLYDDEAYKYSGNNPYYAHMSWNTNSDNRWYLRVSPENPRSIAVDWAYGAPWEGITGKPDMNKIIRGYTLEKDFILSPVGAEYHTRTATKTGCITIYLPTGVTGLNGTKDPMISMWIDVYLYTKQKSFTVFVGGYPYSGNTWANCPHALVIGDNHRVRLGYANNRFVIYIGETNSAWSYPQIKVRDVLYGYAIDTEILQGDWSIDFSTSVSNVTFDTTTYAWTTKNFNPENYSTTSHQHYIGTTQTQTNSAYQTLTGITKITTNWSGNTDYYCTMLIDSATWMNFNTNCTSFYFNKTVSVDGNIYPYSGTRTLGTSSNRWNTLYMNGAILMSLNAGATIGCDSVGGYIQTGNYWLRASTNGINDCLGAFSISNYLVTSAYANIGTYLQTGTYAYIKGAIANDNYKQVRLLGQYTSTGNCTGTIKIQLPNTSGLYLMHYIRIHVYEYSAQGASTITLGGHDWNGSWYNYNYTVKGNYNKGVRLGYDGTKYCILLGTTSTTWSYPGVWVDAIDNVYNMDWNNVFLNGCTCSLITSESGITTVSPSLGNSYASTFYGALSGNASTASKLLDSNSSSNTITASYHSGGYTSSPAYLTAWSGYHLTYCEPKYVTGIGSANKLATARSLWGNSFDGTQNLTGRLTVTSDIRFTPSNSSYEVFQFGAQNSGTHNGYIYGETNSYYLVFLSGNTGVGVSPSTKLDVNGNIKCRSHIFIDNTSAELDISFQKNGANKYLLCGHDNNFVFYRYNSSWSLDALWNYSTGKWTFNKDVTAPNFYMTSDRSKKQNISSLSGHIRKFQLKDTEKWHYGVIALEVEEMFREGEEGNMTVNYNSVLSYYVGLLENKVSELSKTVKQLSEEIDKLKILLDNYLK